MGQDYILGLDIGITSVGYGLIDYHDKSVIDAGVRLFKEANVENNEGRRSKRGSRRLQRRRKHRLARTRNLLESYQLNPFPKCEKNPYEIRVKGLKEVLTSDELSAALLHLAKRRGIDNVHVTDTESDSSDNGLSTKEQLAKNQKALESRYVCELQLERLLNDNKVRGANNRFKTQDFVREAKQILSIQKDHHNLDQVFIDKYISLLETRREYYEGPGKGSPYGWDGDIKKWYELLMGRCTYFPESLRSVKYAYSADLFNALNDLNNLVIVRDENDKLTYPEKYHIVENVFKQRKKPTLKQIAKEIDVAPEDIRGYRVTASGTPVFTSFKLYHDIKSVTSNDKVLEDTELLDAIAEVLTIYQSPIEVQEKLESLNVILTKEEIEGISKLTGYTGTHALSLKAIQIVIDELWETNDNQMTIFTRLNMKPQKVDLAKANKIPTSLVEDFIISPVAKRAFIQSIKVINAVIKNMVCLKI